MALLEALGSPEHPGVGLLIETSGSTGEPKRVRLSSDALIASANAAHQRLGGPGQWLLALPTTYIAGANVLVRSHLSGIEPVEMPAGSFRADEFAACVASMHAARRYSALVPVQLARLIEAAGWDARIRESVADLDAILVGGQASGDNLLTRARELGWNVVVTYGTTETCGGVVYDGEPLDGVLVRIVSGEIWIGGKTLATCYENADGTPDVARTAKKFVDLDGVRWYRTDDAGEFEVSQGSGKERLRVIGRRDRVIVSGGVKVSLVALEDLVRTLPGVVDAVAIPLPSEEWGHRPGLGVEVTSNSTLRVEDIRAQIERELGRVSVPDRIRIQALPRTQRGKTDARALADLLAE